MLFTVSKLEQKQEQLELKQDDMHEKQVEMKNRLDNLESYPYENSRRNPPGIQAVFKRKGHGFEKILA